jgi:hypothetical protein
MDKKRMYLGSGIIFSLLLCQAFLYQDAANCIDSLRIKVKSLEKVSDFLSTREMVGTKNEQRVITDPNKTFGILFEFFEID